MLVDENSMNKYKLISNFFLLNLSALADKLIPDHDSSENSEKFSYWGKFILLDIESI